MDTFVRALISQYDKSLTMLEETITRYDTGLWEDAKNYDSPVWQIVYHTLHYANAYCSPRQENIQKWSEARKDFHLFFGTSEEAPTKEIILSDPYSKDEMLEYLAFVRERIPAYLEEMQPHERCWPPWYDETQFELQLTNIRHIQHHTAQAIERHDIASPFDYEWY